MSGLIGLAFFFSYWISTVTGILLVIWVTDFLRNGFKINKSFKLDNDIAGVIFIIGLVIAVVMSSQ